MKLYYAPGTCALAVHVVLIWPGEPCELEEVDLDDPGFRRINPMGAVPALVDGRGGVMTQAHALLNYVAAKAPEKKLAGEDTARARQAFDQWLSFLNGDLHPAWMPIFKPERFTGERDEASLADVKAAAGVRLRGIYSVLDRHLDGRDFMVGEARTCADAFAYIMTRWLPYSGIGIDEFPNLKRHFGRFRDEPGVVRAEEEQGIRA